MQASALCVKCCALCNKTACILNFVAVHSNLELCGNLKIFHLCDIQNGMLYMVVYITVWYNAYETWIFLHNVYEYGQVIIQRHMFPASLKVA